MKAHTRSGYRLYGYRKMNTNESFAAAVIDITKPNGKDKTVNAPIAITMLTLLLQYGAKKIKRI